MPKVTAKSRSADVLFSSQVVTGLRSIGRRLGKFDKRLERVEAQVKTAGLNGHGAAIQKIASLAEPLVTIAGMEADLKEVVTERRLKTSWRIEQTRLAADEAEELGRNPFVRLWRLLGGHAVTGVASATAGAIIGHLLK